MKEENSQTRNFTNNKNPSSCKKHLVHNSCRLLVAPATSLKFFLQTLGGNPRLKSSSSCLFSCFFFSSSCSREVGESWKREVEEKWKEYVGEKWKREVEEGRREVEREIETAEGEVEMTTQVKEMTLR